MFNKTKITPGLVASSGQETDQVYSIRKVQLPESTENEKRAGSSGQKPVASP